MKRLLLNIVAWLSLILLVSVSLLYARAFFYRDELHTSIFRHDCLAATFPHHVYVLLAKGAAVNGYPTSLKLGQHQYPSMPKYLEPRVSDTRLYLEIGIPLWLPLLFLSGLPIWRGSRALVHRRRRIAGLCCDCGYDLRASPSRCPECGHVVET